MYISSTINVSYTYVDALLYDAPCKNECQPASNSYDDSRGYVYGWNATRIFRPLMEHKEYYVSDLYIVAIMIFSAIKLCISLICSKEHALNNIIHILTALL